MTTRTVAVNSSMFKVRQYSMLLKFRLSSLVVFSGGFGYLLANQTEMDWLRFLVFCLSSFLITGASNTINQIIEKDSDKLMRRTAVRPLPTGNLSVQEALRFSILLALVGTLLLAFFVNLLAAILGLFSLILYAFVYTPLKSRTPFAVLVGAFPGALPPLIGWVAASGNIGMGAILIFSLQFMWQFPHFWAIAWVADEDYSKAGIRLLPSAGGKNFLTAFQIMFYTMFLVPLGLMPYYFGLTGLYSAIIATVCGVAFLMQTFYLMKEGTDRAALLLMFGSFFYLPITQIAYLLDKL